MTTLAEKALERKEKELVEKIIFNKFKEELSQSLENVKFNDFEIALNSRVANLATKQAIEEYTKIYLKENGFVFQSIYFGMLNFKIYINWKETENNIKRARKRRAEDDGCLVEKKIKREG